MAANFLIDTGAILAVLDQRDRWHPVCSKTFRQLHLPALTSEAVLAELFHLVRRSRVEAQKVWTFLCSGAVLLGALDAAELHQLRSLMTRYSDYPMDFADATLVHLAGRESISTILTVDQTDFTTYRINGKGRFRVLPIDRP